MKINVGDYVRTKYNDFCNMVVIRKVEEIDEEDNRFWVDEYIIDTYGDEQNKLSDEDVSKSSPDIIDLVESRDILILLDAEYKTKERALEVLDEIEQYLDKSNFDDLESIVYEMPEN